MLEDPVFLAHVKQFVLDILALGLYYIRTRYVPGMKDRRISNGRVRS